MIRSATVLLATLAAAGCASSGAVPKPFPGAPARRRPASAPGSPSLRRRRAGKPPRRRASVPRRSTDPGALALATALDLRGVPYRNGGSDPSGFDCSGLVQWVFAATAAPCRARCASSSWSAGRLTPTTCGRATCCSSTPVQRRLARRHRARPRKLRARPATNGVVRVERYTSNYWARRYLGARRVE